MPVILGVSGSLRKGSYNAALLRAAAEAMPDGWTLEIGTIKGIPLYDADVEEASGVPEAVEKLKDQIAGASGLLMVTPEYNNSMPGVFKNAIDWLSRPPEDQARVFYNRPVGLIGATPGAFGTAFSQTAWLQVFRLLKMQIWFGDLLWISQAYNVFDAEGNLKDDKVRGKLTKYLSGFCQFVNAVAG